jgi:nitroimidazol reductase NimA-like FMN-containing flavoprotein (pyridoxamine 5'-phosphate oxidase superfamily)
MADAPSDRTTIRRLPERAVYDRDAINAILDEALICQIGFIADGAPVVIPTIHARIDDVLYLHGSPASRMLRAMRHGLEVSINATIVDGLVVARAAFHNSLNYRSVVLFGTARVVDDPDEKRAAMKAVTEHVIPGRWADSRPMTDKEAKGTLIAAIAIDEVSAKVRTGGPKDDDEDYGYPTWAGTVPLRLRAGEPIPDPLLTVGVPVPDYLTGYDRTI